MQRKNFYLTEPHLDYLERESKKMDVSVSEIIRRVLEEKISNDKGVSSMSILKDDVVRERDKVVAERKVQQVRAMKKHISDEIIKCQQEGRTIAVGIQLHGPDVALFDNKEIEDYFKDKGYKFEYRKTELHPSGAPGKSPKVIHRMIAVTE